GYVSRGPGEQHGHLGVGFCGVDRQVVGLAEVIHPDQLGVINHQVCALRERAVAAVATNAAQLRWPRSSAVDDPIAAHTQLGCEFFGESLIVVGYENGAHIKYSSDRRLETILPPSWAMDHAQWGGLGMGRAHPRR